jgi:1,2-diacylglycerol 3-alpha-glucosyltransferase
MKIALFTDNFYPEISGISDSILLAGKALARRGHTVDFYAPIYSKKNYSLTGATTQDPKLEGSSNVYRMISFSYPTPTLQGRFVIPNIFRFLGGKKKYDVIHSHSFFSAGVDALCLSKFTKAPLVGTNHTHLESFMQYGPVDTAWSRKLAFGYMTWYYNNCKLVTSPSQFLIDDMKKKGLKGEPVLVSNPIDDEFFQGENVNKAELKKRLGLFPFTLLYAGRVSEEKKVHVLLDAFIKFAENTPDAGLVIVGEGSMKKELEKRAAASTVASQILFRGPYIGEKKKDLIEFFHAADVFTIASTSEIQSMVVLQAMACGLPIIAADASGLPALVGQDRGLLFPCDDVGALKKTLETMYIDEALREKASFHAKQFALSRKSDAIAEIWEKLYSNVIQKK